MERTVLHAGWEFIQSSTEGKDIGYSKAEWLPAVVPGHVHLDLMSNGIIPDPHEKMHEIGVQWVDQEDWSYRTTFNWSPSDFKHRVLRFEGLDTIATVSLNGTEIGKSENMFIPLEIDVTEQLVEGANELRIDFKSAIKVGNEIRDAYFDKEGLADPKERFDERAFVRKAQCMYGWDWGPRLVSCGIWKPVVLLEFNARITDVWFRWEEDGDTIKVWAETEQDGTGDFAFTLEGPEHEIGWKGSEVVRIPKDSVSYWHPDEPTCYDLTAVLSNGTTAEDIQLLTVGFSSPKLLREKDQWGESFEFEINGEKIWARGANWIPDYSFPSAISVRQYESKVWDAKGLNCNMLRIWGGGLYEADAFYEACSAAGIMVWQDFPFACGYYPDDEEWQAKIAEEAKANIKRLRNYPCLALWCGNNENHQMWEQKWGPAENHPPRYYGENLYFKTLPDAVNQFDPARGYISSSPIGTSPEPQAQGGWSGDNAGGYGDQHNWDVWHGRGDWRFYSESDGRFSSEYGFASSCSLAVWNNVIGKSAEKENYRNPVYRWHDKTGKGYETYIGYVELHYPVSKNVGDWVYYSQLNQRDALRHGVEHYRRAEFCRGSLIWQMNDIWPVQSWAYFDSAANPKPLAYELERLYDDVLISLVRNNDLIEVYVCNDGRDEIADEVTVSAHNLQTGEVLASTKFEFELGINQRMKLGELSVHGLSVPDTIVFADSGTGASTFRLLAEPKNAQFADPAPITVSRADDADVVTIQTTQPVVDLVLTIDGATRPFDMNALTLPHAGFLYTMCEGDLTKIEARSLAGNHPVIFTRSPLG